MIRGVAILAASLELVWAAVAFAAPPSLPEGQKWRAISALSDEFDGPLDTTRWLSSHPYWTGRSPSQFDTRNVSTSGGYLRLTSKKMTPPSAVNWISAACASSTQPIANFGYYEARIKASYLPMTSSFWFQGKHSEIDVVEAFGMARHVERRTEMRSTIHFFTAGWKTHQSQGSRHVMKTPLTDWHVYGVWWRNPHSVWLYLDGEKVGELVTVPPFDEPMYMFFDTEAFPSEGLPTDVQLANPTGNTMLVDWVHAYALVH